MSIDPNDFVITRKRKKYKFAKFANASNCFEFDEWVTQGQAWTAQGEPKIGEWVDQGQALRGKVTVELGAGTGLFSVELAARHPEITFVAVDVKADRLQKGAYLALERGLQNVMFVRARADQIDQLFDPASVEQLWLTFADPFPKKRSSSRRMTHQNFLDKYRSILSPNGSFLVKHDNPDFFKWSLEQLVAGGWRIDELAFDLHDSDLNDDYKILTTYEQRWLSEGRTVGFVRSSCS